MATSNINNLKQATVLLTRNCNLRCKFCFEKNAGYDVRDQMSFEDLKKVIDFCADAHIKYIFLSGGEPLTYPYLIDALKYIESKGESMIPTIATNGVLLDELSFCKQLIEHGITYIDISMKGTSSTAWINAVGYDGYERQLKAIRNLSTLPLEFTCSMVVTFENVNAVCEQVQIAMDHGAKQFSFTFFIDNNLSDVRDVDYLKKYNPCKLIAVFIENIDRLNEITNDWWVEYSFPLCMYTDEQLSVLKGKLASPCQIHMKDAITFDTKLNLLPCDMYFQSKLGKLGETFTTYKEFIDLTNKQPYADTMSHLRKLPSSQCTSCSKLKDCYGVVQFYGKTILSIH